MKPALIRYLIGILNREIGYCGLDTKAGRDAQRAIEILTKLL